MLADLERIMQLRDEAEPWLALSAWLALPLTAAITMAIFVWTGGR